MFVPLGGVPPSVLLNDHVRFVAFIPSPFMTVYGGSLMVVVNVYLPVGKYSTPPLFLVTYRPMSDSDSPYRVDAHYARQ